MKNKLIVFILLLFVFIPTVNATVYNLTEKVTIFSDYQSEIPFVIEGTLDTYRWFTKRGFGAPYLFVVVVTPETNTFGYFDSRFVYIRPKINCKKFFGVDINNNLYRSMVAYEVAHAFLYNNGYNDFIGYKYLAFNVLFDILKRLDKELLNKILDKYKDYKFEDIYNINEYMYKNNWESFGVMCYKHRLKTKGKLLKRILKGKLIF